MSSLWAEQWYSPSLARWAAAASRRAYQLATHPAFENVIMCIIVANTVVMAMESYPGNEARDATLENINFGLTLVVRSRTPLSPAPAQALSAHPPRCS